MCDVTNPSPDGWVAAAARVAALFDAELAQMESYQESSTMIGWMADLKARVLAEIASEVSGVWAEMTAMIAGGTAETLLAVSDSKNELLLAVSKLDGDVRRFADASVARCPPLGDVVVGR